MAWGSGNSNHDSLLHSWLTYAHLGFNQTSSTIHSTLNQTGDALALSSQPYHEDIRVLGSLLGMVPFHLLVFFHGLYTSAGIRPTPMRPYWLLCFWTCLMSGYGGGTLTNLMLQEHLLWWRDDKVLPIFAIAWWLVMYSPVDLGFRVYKMLPVKAVSRACAGILRARVIISRLELAVLKFSPHALVAPLFFGTLGGCGGKLSVDFILFFFDPGFRPPELLYPGWFLRSAFLISLCYMGSVHWLHILPHDVAFIVLATFLVAHGLTEEILGHPVDLTAQLGYLFHMLTGVPQPPNKGKTPTQRQKNGEYAKKVM